MAKSIRCPKCHNYYNEFYTECPFCIAIEKAKKAGELSNCPKCGNPVPKKDLDWHLKTYHDPLAERTHDWPHSGIFNYHIEKPVKFPVQGWKIHVSADTNNAAKVFDIVKPILEKEKISFKAVSDTGLLEHLNSGSQVGKFITIYPQSEKEAVKIAQEVDRALEGKGLKGPKALNDTSFGNSGLVFYRYGGLRDITEKEIEKGRKDFGGMLVRSDRSLEPDVRNEEDNLASGKPIRKEIYKPDWMSDPFKAAEKLLKSKVSSIEPTTGEPKIPVLEKPKVISTPSEIIKEGKTMGLLDRIFGRNKRPKQTELDNVLNARHEEYEKGIKEQEKKIESNERQRVWANETVEEYKDSQDYFKNLEKERNARRLAQRYVRPSADWQGKQIQEEEISKEILEKQKTRASRKAGPGAYINVPNLLNLTRGGAGGKAAAAGGSPPGGGPPPGGGGPPSGGGGIGPGLIQCTNIGCRIKYPRNLPRCPNCGTQNPAFFLKGTQVLCQCGNVYEISRKACPKCGAPNPKYGLKGDEVRCPNCGKIYPMDITECPKCKEPNPRYVLKRGQTRCGQCGKVIDINWDFCKYCGAHNAAKPKTTGLGESVGFRISGRTYEILMYELAGVFCIFGLPILGLPQLLYLGIVLMVLFPFYTYLPGEHEVLASREEGEQHLGTAGAASLVLKSNIKLISFTLTVFQFTPLIPGGVPVSSLIPLAISFVYYFDLPTSYRTSQPSKMIEAWLRLVVGIVIAGFFLLGFAGTTQGTTLAFMSLAFFCTSFPTQKEEKEPGVVRVELLSKAYGGNAQKGAHIIGKGLFLFFMGFALLYSNIPFSTSNDMSIIFYTVFILSLFSGLMTGPEGRPAMGILMIIMTLFVFSFMFTGIIGQAVFGYWWPQIYGFVDSAVTPLIPLWQQMTAGMGDAWLLLTNPMQYYNMMMMRQQATQSVVKTGGTTKSIELLKFDIFTSLTGTLEPLEDPVVGSIELQNQGEFEANKLTLTFVSSFVNAQSVSISAGTTEQEPCGSLDKLECSAPNNPTKSGSRGTCLWQPTPPDVIYPDEIKMATFAYKNDAWIFTDINGTSQDLATCVLNGVESTYPSACYSDPNSTYKFGGNILKIDANYTYDYNVNVSIPVEVIEESKYIQLLAARQITLQELTSQYSGGPVKATLWSQKQPIRNKEVALFVASFYNDGTGLLNQIYSFNIKIPAELGTVEIISQSFRISAPPALPDGCTYTPGNPYNIIHCQHTCGESCVMKPGEFKRVSFFVTPNYGAELIDRKTSLIIGLGSYEYTKSTSQSLTIANFPPH